MDGRRIRNNKVAFSNLSGIVWTGPQLPTSFFAMGIISGSLEHLLTMGVFTLEFEFC